VLDFGRVGVPGRSVVIACTAALVLAPAAATATRDLTVGISRLSVPVKLRSGQPVSFGVRYVVRGPATRTAMATVVLQLTSKTNRYRVSSLPARVRPAIWKWDVKDTLPRLAAGKYTAIATVTLRRSGKAIYTTRRTIGVSVS
jgi:hypothetical protein